MNEYMIVNVEQCYGSSNLYACTEGQGQGQACQMGVLPTKNNWAYKTDGVQICTKTTHGDEKCNPIHDHPSTSHQSLTIPLSNGNVYIWIAGHNAEYEIQILETKYGGHQQAILIQGDSSYSMMNTLIHADVEYDTVTISWIASLVVFPGMKRPVFTTNVKYYIIAVNMDHIHESEKSSRLFSSLTSERFGRLFLNLYFEMSLQRFCRGADPTVSPKCGDSQRELRRCDCLGETMAGWSLFDIPR